MGAAKYCLPGKSGKIQQEHPRTTAKKKIMLEALKKNMGIVAAACVVTGINRDTHYSWLQKDPSYKEKVEEIDEKIEGGLA